jgi:hypothetical protein
MSSTLKAEKRKRFVAQLAAGTKSARRKLPMSWSEARNP